MRSVLPGRMAICPSATCSRAFMSVHSNVSGGEPDLLAPAPIGDALRELAVPRLEADVAQRVRVEVLEHVAVGALLLGARVGDVGQPRAAAAEDHALAMQP